MCVNHMKHLDWERKFNGHPETVHLNSVRRFCGDVFPCAFKLSRRICHPRPVAVRRDSDVLLCFVRKRVCVRAAYFYPWFCVTVVAIQNHKLAV